MRAGSGGNGGSRKRGAGAKLERTNITFRVPGEGAHTFERIRQDGLNEYMRLFRAKGFRTAGGRLSRYLEDLPEGGTVDLALLEWLSVEKQVGHWGVVCRLAGHQACCPACHAWCTCCSPTSPAALLPLCRP